MRLKEGCPEGQCRLACRTISGSHRKSTRSGEDTCSSGALEWRRTRGRPGTRGRGRNVRHEVVEMWPRGSEYDTVGKNLWRLLLRHSRYSSWCGTFGRLKRLSGPNPVRTGKTRKEREWICDIISIDESIDGEVTRDPRNSHLRHNISGGVWDLNRVTVPWHETYLYMQMCPLSV